MRPNSRSNRHLCGSKSSNGHRVLGNRPNTPMPMTMTMAPEVPCSNMAFGVDHKNNAKDVDLDALQDEDDLAMQAPPPLERKRSASPRSVSGFPSEDFFGKDCDFTTPADDEDYDDVGSLAVHPLPLITSVSTDIRNLMQDFRGHDVVREVLPKTKLTFYSERDHMLGNIDVNSDINRIDREIKEVEAKIKTNAEKMAQSASKTSQDAAKIFPDPFNNVIVPEVPPSIHLLRTPSWRDEGRLRAASPKKTVLRDASPKKTVTKAKRTPVKTKLSAKKKSSVRTNAASNKAIPDRNLSVFMTKTKHDIFAKKQIAAMKKIIAPRPQAKKNIIAKSKVEIDPVFIIPNQPSMKTTTKKSAKKPAKKVAKKGAKTTTKKSAKKPTQKKIQKSPSGTPKTVKGEATKEARKKKVLLEMELVQKTRGKPSAELIAELRAKLADKSNVKWAKMLEQDVWEMNYMKLVEFFVEHGHSNVLRSDPDTKLSGWVKRQRNNLKQGKLATFHIDCLNALNFVWNRLEYAWYSKYGRLKEFYAEFKHTNVPANYDRTLAEWTQRQRRNYFTGSMEKLSMVRIEKLEAIPGWQWEKVRPKQWGKGRSKKGSPNKSSKSTGEDYSPDSSDSETSEEGSIYEDE